MHPEGKVIPVRVAVRCRPLIPKELLEGCQQCLTFIKDEPQVIVGRDRAFTYDYTFGPEVSQDRVYKKAVQGLVFGIFKGYNATVLAYGQTGSGKTYTMGTVYDAALHDDETLLGVIPRVVQDLFDGVNEREDYTFVVKVTFLEIYNEELKDLLSSKQGKTEPLVVREDPNGSIRLQGLQEVEVKTLEQTMSCLEHGSKNRTTGATAMNATSSRSHAIFTIVVEQRKKDDVNDFIRSKFHLVDLAGSERAKRTQAEGERFKEGVSINKGLLALGNVISALGEDVQKRSHIPYRDSKLTRLLQDSLGGNSHTVMIACVSPADSNLEETINSLRYADRARKIKNKPVINRDPQMAEIIRLRQLVQDLQVQLVSGGVATTSTGSVASSTNRLSESGNKGLMERNNELIEENEKLAEELRMAVDQNTTMCEKLVCAELARDSLKEKLAALRHQADLHLESLNNSLAAGDHTQASQQLEQMKDIQTKIEELETLEAAEELDAEALETSQESVETIKADGEEEEESAKYALRQAKMGRELQELNKMLLKKQELANQMAVNEEGMTKMKRQYEGTMLQLENDVSRLQSEKEELQLKLHDAKTSNASSKVSEQRRKRLVELESALGQLKKKIADQTKLLKVKDQTDKQCTKLGSEIKAMKQHRVRLMKQMKEDAETFRKWRQQKDKEVLQLKAKDRKRQFEIARLERDYSKQQAVLRRKADEAASANRRLKEALQKQKTAQTEREKQLKVSDGSGIGQRVRNWLSRDFEVQVSLEEAKHHLNSLLADRKQLTEQLAELNEKISEPPKKKPAWSENNLDTSIESKRQQQIKDLQNDLRLRNAQITDLQEKVLDADQDGKKKTSWSNVKTMVEAKCAMKWLLTTAVSAKCEAQKLKSNLVDVKESNTDTSSTISQLEKQIVELKSDHDEEKTEMQKQHQQKVLYLLKQLQTMKHDDKANMSLDESTKERLKFQEEQIERLGKISEELEERTEECQSLQQEITVLKYQAGGRASLMPSLCDAAASPFVFKTPVPIKRPEGKKKALGKPISMILEEDTRELDEVSSEEEWSDGVDSDYFPADNDSDYFPTPMKKRIKKEARATKMKKNTSCQSTTVKALSCACRTGCLSKRCRCKGSGTSCSEVCGCVDCKNREEVLPDSTVGIDKETDSILQTTASTTSTTIEESRMELNTTFCIQDNSPAEVQQEQSPKRKSLKDTSNISDSSLEKTNIENNLPKRKRKLAQKFFPLLNE